MSRTSKQHDLDLSLAEDSPVPLYLRVKQMISQK
ncbi:MAG: histidine utilization repressor, partial [Acinetobacter sp.]|nr:histidine utilization repressor [Acinetobacter sp.]